ncbi:hypothetical protein DF3PA_100016 [Candidatus Defluviicoccus seviourii]|uniref:Uncharacterized protein n=1 Tax=Candidatus Defluviicoccus seviourii TaxID=2565273 RepID=A0A564W9P2_9PROT|nr:hypothetical protein DF3PA_100016 [Candidatus Defluviicoccus seviourii]
MGMAEGGIDDPVTGDSENKFTQPDTRPPIVLS